jgi:hypothetical protein
MPETMEDRMSDEEMNWQDPRKPVRDPGDYPGYPPVEVREGIRQWGSPGDWQQWQDWEQFIRGDAVDEPASLANWLPGHELVRREREREAEEAERQRKAELRKQVDSLMREQVAALEHALNRGYVRSPLIFAHEGYPGSGKRVGDGRGKGMWGGMAWEKAHGPYARAWDAFMKGERETPPRSSRESASETGVQK